MRIEDRARAISKRHGQAVDAATALDWRVVDLRAGSIEFAIPEWGGERFVVVNPDHLHLCAVFHDHRDIDAMATRWRQG